MLDGRARLFTMPFSATLTMWQLSFALGAIDLRSEDVLGLRTPRGDLEEHRGRRRFAYQGDEGRLVAAFRDRDQMVVASGSRSRVTVLGDACHPMTCFKGQGANQALADAVLLARRVAEANDMPKALRRFEREMVQRAGPRAAASRCAARLLHSPPGREGGAPSFARVDDSAPLRAAQGKNGVTAATPDLERAVRAVIYGNGVIYKGVRGRSESFSVVYPARAM